MVLLLILFEVDDEVGNAHEFGINCLEEIMILMILIWKM